MLNKEWLSWIENNILRKSNMESLIEILIKSNFDNDRIIKSIIHVYTSIIKKLENGLPLYDLRVEPKLLNEETERWLELQLKQQVRVHYLLDTLLKQGYALSDLQQKISACRNNIVNENRSLQAPIILQMDAPKLVVYQQFLSHAECDELIELAHPRMQRSTVVDNNTGIGTINEIRTSDTTYFHRGEMKLIDDIEDRIAELLIYPINYGEGLQILHYRSGAEYKPHFDYFNEATSGGQSILQKGGQRTATFIMYLTDVEEGGETIFPKINLKVKPIKGNALLFSYYDNGKLDPLTLHGGRPVIKGQKYIATKWLRECIQI